MQSKFYVAHNGEQKGPYSAEDILQNIENGQLDQNDYCFCELKNDWILFSEQPTLKTTLDSYFQRKMAEKVKMPSAPPPKASKSPTRGEGIAAASPEAQAPTPSIKPAVHHTEWFILKGQSKSGPFTYKNLVQMLQEKSLFEFDFIWNAQMEGWARVAERAEFSAEAIRKLQSNPTDEDSDVFFRRRHARVEWESSIIVHDNRHIWKGTSLELSAGGAGVIIDSPELQPGQVLYFHFKPADGLPPFNAVCEVVSKQFVKDNRKSAKVRYGVKFTNINAASQKHINEYASDRTNKKVA